MEILFLSISMFSVRRVALIWPATSTRRPRFYGRCECGGVRYKDAAPAGELYHCHRSRCRRLHGALFATYAYIESDQLVIEQGAENTASYSSPLANWCICRICRRGNH